MAYVIKNSEGKRYCGTHYHTTKCAGIERWGEPFPYYENENRFFFVERFDTRDEAEEEVRRAHLDDCGYAVTIEEEED